ncbi:MAG: iron-sulfur cluster assembly scaffold protein [candidate division WOR-3 bacterium]|jgi:nitrogen fixation NifU-like protein
MNPFEHPLFIYYKYPRYKGKLKKFNASFHLGNPSCGDEIIFYVYIEDNKIKEISYEGHGCSISQASADILSDWAINKTVEEVLKLSDSEFLDMLGGVIQTRLKCALLSIETLRKALKEVNYEGYKGDR